MFLISWLPFFFIWAILLRYGMRVRIAFLSAHVIHALIIVLLTELLSWFHALSAWPLFICWVIIFIITLVYWFRLRGKELSHTGNIVWGKIEKALLAAVGCIVLVTGIVALVAPPNNLDSMTYHLARIAHWAYNESLLNYPTGVLRQLVYPPYSEYAILHSYILGGSDYFANLVQWNSMLASLAGVSLIAEMLGGALQAQLIAVLYAATLPMGILQSSSTQNDYVATLWAVCVIVFALLLIKTEKVLWGVLGALSFALAFFTKGLAVIVGGPFILWALWEIRWKLSQKIALLLFGVICVLAVNAPFLLRLTEISPNPYKAMTLAGDIVTVERLDIRGILSNIVRGVAVELASPFPASNAVVLNLAGKVHDWLGLDVNDPRYTFADSKFILSDDYPVMDEECATSWIHAVLYLVVAMYLAGLAISVFLFKKDDKRPLVLRHGNGLLMTNRVLWGFLAAFTLAALIFSAYFKWQAWIPRFHLPFFVIFSAVAGVVGSACINRRLSIMIAAIMLMLALGPLFLYPQRSIFPTGAITLNLMKKHFVRGEEIFYWLRNNGFFRETTGDRGFFNDLSDSRLNDLKLAFPEENEKIIKVLSHAASLPGGIFFTPREELLFAKYGKFSRDSLIYSVRFIRQQLAFDPGCSEIGLAGDLEYPLWRLLNSDGHRIRVEHVLVENASRHLAYPRGEPDPCMIIHKDGGAHDTIEYQKRLFVRRTYGPLQVYVRSAGEEPGGGADSAPR